MHCSKQARCGLRVNVLQGTYYGTNGNVNGSCGFGGNGANSLKMPWTSGTTMTVAVNDDQFAEGLTCGLCIKFRGIGTGIGTQPIPQTWTNAIVDNRYACTPSSTICSALHSVCSMTTLSVRSTTSHGALLHLS